MTDIVLATGNAHKVVEIQKILGPEMRLRCQSDFPGAPSAVEDAGTFAGNAAKKAEGLASWLGTQCRRQRLGGSFFVLADDSGLEVDALGGAPGVYSARFAADDAGAAANSSDAANNAKLLRLLEGVPTERRRARFRCVLALATHDKATRFFEGTCDGRIAFGAAGAGGFGYDPLFIPDGGDRSFAELAGVIKNQISHRARALAQLRHFLDGAPVRAAE